ncbi:LOW QUALITY PROTEIN: kelch repeat and BTB domain-containing protein 11-like [Anabas testudineus]|uniref:LOW QUALITY PROTEIN: kelch repeat and BTB domain-containing protein 11-like n=1 Tax=Anabas testudineus TaxID=64144 RepID=UPI000E465078|nr:LOW QUALITY PROTEIN: kelch repeat and BTB domain-containing protein 11-like [Anabas testudineus]
MEVSEGAESLLSSGDLCSHLGSAAADMSQLISAENCYEVLTKAKDEGAEGVRDRVYRFMSDHYLQVLRAPGVYGRLTAGERELILALRMEGREVLAVAETFEVHDRGGSRDSSRPQSPLQPAPEDAEHRRVFCLRTDTRQWEVLTSLPEEIPDKGSGMCTLYNYLFVAGGISAHGDGRSKASDRVFCFNPQTGAWSQVRPLSQPRCQLRLVSMDGHLYAIGGECLFTVERYDPRADRWSPVAPLPRGSFAVAHEATSCGGELFVSGGSLFNRLLRYDSRRDEWEECPFNESRRRSTDMVARRSLVYRFDVDRERAAVNVYRYNTVVKVWHGGASFPLDKPLPFRCAVLGDRIYCVNRSHTLQFEVGGEREGFLPEVLPSPAEARGALVPFVLCLNRDK